MAIPRPPLHRDSFLLMSKLSSAQVKETQRISFCTWSQTWTCLSLDGKQIYCNSRDKFDTHQFCTVPREVKAGFHFIQASAWKNDDRSGRSSSMMTYAKCKDNSNWSFAVCSGADKDSYKCAQTIPGCGLQEDVRPVMSWPPVCGDAVKSEYVSVDREPPYGTLGNKLARPWE